MKKGFTLIELLVVVLIIGILSAIALPQYTKAVERARMTEAITNLRAIINANQVFYLANGRYAEDSEIDLLGIDIPGEVVTSGWLTGRIATKNFLYSPNGNGNAMLALVKRIQDGDANTEDKFYYIYVPRSAPDRIICSAYDSASNVMKKLCEQINQQGTL